MDYITVFILALGLSFDSFAVSIISGLSIPHIRFLQAVQMAAILALFQAVMPLLGWLLESSMRRFIEPVDHWIVFVILSLIGGKMIMESLIHKDDREIKNPLKLQVTLVLAIVTSIDALAVGFSMAIFMTKILAPIFVIGVVTFIASMTGVLIGKRTGSRINKYAEILGGIILFSIGAKILLEHLMSV